jgi:hypothetical protein
MSTSDILILAGIIAAFVAFAVVLAWGDYQSMEIARKSRARALSGAMDNSGIATHH